MEYTADAARMIADVKEQIEQQLTSMEIDWGALKKEARAKIAAEQAASGESKRLEYLKTVNRCFAGWYDGKIR